ncbi:MAG: hypothetical protein QOD76_1170 [Solirubrobacteraceae bacterium]|nr:hypothetical protein [Solirubrobacteraceae bacterium]
MPEGERPDWRDRIKRFLLGRIAAAVWRRRRTPRLALRARRAERQDRRAGRIPPPPSPVRTVSSVVCFISGPGRPKWLEDSIESVLASEGDDAHVIVIDDCSVDARESVIRARFPQVEVLRRSFPTGGPPQTWAQLQLGLRHAMEHHDFERFVRLDTDALVVGPSLSARLGEALASAPEAGLAGSFRVRADGAPEERDYHIGVIERELRHDRTLADAVSRARANGWQDGDVVQGGAMCLTAAAARAMQRDGWLDWRQSWHSIVTDDLAMSMFVSASGMGLHSIGDPQGIFAVANKDLPLPKEQLAGDPWVIAHSTRAGRDGEDEATLRAFFREQRASWPKPGS